MFDSVLPLIVIVARFRLIFKGNSPTCGCVLDGLINCPYNPAAVKYSPIAKYSSANFNVFFVCWACNDNDHTDAANIRISV